MFSLSLENITCVLHADLHLDLSCTFQVPDIHGQQMLYWTRDTNDSCIQSWLTWGEDHVHLGYLLFRSPLYPVMFSVTLFEVVRILLLIFDVTHGRKERKWEAGISCLSLSRPLLSALPSLPTSCPPHVPRFILLCYWMVYDLVCSWFKYRVIKCFMFSFSKNVYLLKASYFSIPVMQRAFELQRFSTTRMQEITLCIWAFESFQYFFMMSACLFVCLSHTHTHT